MAVDYGTRVVFLDEDVMVVYYTRQEGKDLLTAPRFIEAFFIRASDGSLLTTRRWSTTLRKSNNDLFDSESRLIPLHDGRFLVFANGVMTTYGPNVELLIQKKLQPSTGMWSAQRVADGKGVFLRHQSTSGQVTYFWLASDTLEERYQTPGYKSPEFGANEGLTAAGDSVLATSRSGIRAIDRDQKVRTICDDSLCRQDGLLQALSSPYVGWSTRNGIGIINAEQGGLVWSRTVPAPMHHENFQFGEIQSATSGTEFAVWATAIREARFDGIKVGSQPTILVYDAARLKEEPTAFRLKPRRPDWGLALSPSGGKLALFDGETVQVFTSPLAQNP